MGRPKEGWTLRRRKGELIYTARFTDSGGKRREPSTGESDWERANAEAAKLYARAIGGQGIPQRIKRPVSTGSRVEEVGLDWLNKTASSRDPQTNKTYAIYVNAHFAPFFETLDQVAPMVDDYIAVRLSKVKGKTLSKELGALRALMAWAHKRGLVGAVTIPGIPKRATGTAHPKGKRTHTDLSPAQVKRFLAALPKWTEKSIVWGRQKGRHEIPPWPMRAFYTVLYETTLRPETIFSLRFPDNYTKGAKWLAFPDEHDKARMGRRVPLSVAARKALDSALPAAAGPIFIRRTCRKVFRRIAAEVLPADKAATLHPYDLRGLGGTHRIDRNAPLTGVQWLFGHKSIATTAKYVRGSERAAEQALATDVSGERKRPPRN